MGKVEEEPRLVNRYTSVLQTGVVGEMKGAYHAILGQVIGKPDDNTHEKHQVMIPWCLQQQQSRLGNRHRPVAQQVGVGNRYGSMVQQARVVGEMKGIPDEGDSSVRRARNTE